MAFGHNSDNCRLQPPGFSTGLFLEVGFNAGRGGADGGGVGEGTDIWQGWSGADILGRGNFGGKF